MVHVRIFGIDHTVRTSLGQVFPKTKQELLALFIGIGRPTYQSFPSNWWDDFWDNKKWFAFLKLLPGWTMNRFMMISYDLWGFMVSLKSETARMSHSLGLIASSGKPQPRRTTCRVETQATVPNLRWGDSNKQCMYSLVGKYWEILSTIVQYQLWNTYIDILICLSLSIYIYVNIFTYISS